jgi:HK97 family phage major capsid protein
MELSHGQSVIRLKDITSELERLGAIEDPTAEQEQQFDELTREFGEVDAHRRKLERNAALARVRGAAQATERVPAALNLRTERGSGVEPGSNYGNDYDRDPLLNPDDVRSGRFRNPWDLSEVRTFSRSREEVTQELRARAISAVEKMSGANDKIRAAATHVLEMFDDKDGSIARMALATSSPEYLRAWQKVAMGRGHLVSPEEQRALERAMSLTDAEGGYLVPFQLDPTLVLTSTGTRNPIRQISRKVVATGDVWNGVSASDVVWHWRPEEEETTDDTPTFGPLAIPNHKANGFVPISIEAMGDAANVTAEVGRLLARGKDTLEAEALTVGTGTNQPTGIVTALAASAGGISIVTAAGEAFTIADLYALDGALPTDFRSGSSYVANRAIFNLVRQFDTAGGANLWERIGADVPNQLLGRPAYEAENMDDTWNPAAAGDNYVLIYGDFENYVITDRIGMTVEFIPHLMGANRRPTGQRGWYAWYRVGADSINDNAFRMLNIETAV